MNLADYDYELPENLIATQPPAVRGSSRLLVLNRKTGEITHDYYANLPGYLASGDLIVRNNTQVIKARLLAKTESGDDRELLLLESHAVNNPHKRKVLYRGKIRAGDTLMIGEDRVHVEEVLGGGEAIIAAQKPLLSIADEQGKVPLPPYMHREATANDSERYQTVFAAHAGSVAAPTASLNFTHQLESLLDQKGVLTSELTLHVGLGTFLPIRVDTLENHKMHSEYFVVPKSTKSAINRCKLSKNKVLAIGTTVTRTLEYAAVNIAEHANEDSSGEADIFIYPGYDFKTVDALLTNFHAPKSTVLMMAAAFAGWDNLLTAYNEAIKENYAFLSYGDSMLII